MEERNTQVTETPIKETSRREFLKTTGKTVASIALAGSVVNILTGCEPAYESPYPEKVELTYEYKTRNGEDAPEFPFPYQKLDPTTVAERAYAAYQQKGG